MTSFSGHPVRRVASDNLQRLRLLDHPPARMMTIERGAVTLSDEASKSTLRTAALAARDALPVAERRRAAQTIAMRRFPVPLGEGTIVAGYSPIRSECDPVPLMRSLAAKGAQLALPVVHAKDKELTFSEWRQGEQLVAGPFGILQPRVEAMSARSRYHSGAARGLRPPLPPHRLRRGLLRPHAADSAETAADHRRRHRFCGARSRGNPGGEPRRAPRSCANGT